MKKNISLLTFTVQTVNSSYWELESYSFENFVVNQDSFTWLMILFSWPACLIMYWHCDENLDLDHSRNIKGFLIMQTRKDHFNTFYYMASSLSGQDEQNIALWLVTQAGKEVLSSSRTVKVSWLGANVLWISFWPTITFLGQMDEKFKSFSGLGR